MRQTRLSSPLLWTFFLAFLAAQIWFVQKTRETRSAIEDMPPPPTQLALEAQAFGDREFLFRHLGRWLQQVGDGGGRVKPLRDFDYDRVTAWLKALDSLDQRSEFVHKVAALYFGEIVISPERLAKIVMYLRGIAMVDPAREWEWIVWGANAVRGPAKDHALAIVLAHDLQSDTFKNPAVPAWVRLISVSLYKFAGDQAAANDALKAMTQADREAIEAERREFVRKMQGFRK